MTRLLAKDRALLYNKLTFMVDIDKIISLCKRRGFVFPGSEIYGGLANSWDYGPLGVELKNNIKNLWWKRFVHGREDMVGIDAALIMNPKVWEVSGHLANFSDPLVECRNCHTRLRADQLDGDTCPQCGKKDLTSAKQFNLMLKTFLGPAEEKANEVFFRPETAQAMFVDFKNVLDTSRKKIPFGIAQIGKAFRNEITPGNFIFRTREFEQMEVQFYIKPDETEGKKWFEYWKQNRMDWYLSLGMKEENLRFRDHADDERAHYAKAATDIEYNSPWGWQEFMGVHHRGNWDLSRHQQYSGQNLSCKDPQTGEEFIPWDIETSAGVDRSLLFFLIDGYTEENERIFLRLHPKLAPYKAAIFPLLANKPELVELAKKIYQDLKKDLMVAWDERGNIGGRNARQDEIGTPFCITVDFDTLEDESVTVRDRDSAKQERVKIAELKQYIMERLR